LIYVDEEMFDPETETNASPRSWNLCDDLGQIEYIFSDKTGTLTCNVMEFRKCSINGIAYGLYNSAPSAQASQENLDKGNTQLDSVDNIEMQEKAEMRMREIMSKNFDVKYVSKDRLSFIDPEMHEQIAEGLGGSGRGVILEQATAIIEFFSLLAVCHTVLVDTPEPNCLNYKAQSPDEAALVAAARDNGFTFLKREDDRVYLDIMGTEKVFTILHVIEFSSDRKRMSVLVKKDGSPEIILLCKGADSVIYERLKKDTSETLLRLNTRHLEMFANDGLRTLCLAFRIVPQEEYENWVIEYENAHASLENRNANIDRVSSLIEIDLNLMGATAIEDKLQDGVPECIATLAKAGIKLWVLTVGYLLLNFL
jgi:phospholipid-translocating ATPase